MNQQYYLTDVQLWAAKLASERITVMVQEFESPILCICLWLSVSTDEQQALLGPFSTNPAISIGEFVANVDYSSLTEMTWRQLSAPANTHPVLPAAQETRSNPSAREASLKVWDVFISVRSKLQWFFVLREIHAPDSASHAFMDQVLKKHDEEVVPV
ncbi:uncharacterized protein HD556DRAFT_1309092 [Suillus plorans]|uniref:Uncharacterized protein n=1 Tax=Suillus plorans TaxID=116603 RepID=A0A9P7DHE8_9AGAM|nr:uncharacterized protein HD556DRAFT_1309092 [Suillus plorans]KAG1792802.1 hypothetical protein HD556DRAFT_1309092 [Suillus plorans]